MIGLTLAIGEFMGMLVTSALWVAGGVLAWLMAGAGVVGGGWMLVRRMVRGRSRLS
jgi:hypothetical protein